MAHQLHFVMIPLMSPGHLVPMTDMAKLLAQRGVISTIVTTPLNAIRLIPIINRAIESGLPIRLLQLQLPLHEAGLPEGCENMDSVPSRALIRNFFAALSKLQQPLEQLLEEMEPSPSCCIIADKNLTWTGDIADKFHIPRLLFDGTSCFNLLCCHNIHVSKVNESTSVLDSEPFVVPGLPDRIEITKAQLPTNLNPSEKDFKDLHEKIRASEEGAYGVVSNGPNSISKDALRDEDCPLPYKDITHSNYFQCGIIISNTLELEYVKGYRKTQADRVWCIGSVSLSSKTELDKVQRGNKSSIDEKQCLKWLDLWPQSSVVYACLGSLCRLTLLQLIEVGLGLEACNRPFIWVVRGGKNGEIEKWIVEDGFEERTKGRGLLIRGWAPQVLILSHPAIGGFLTHCGWNSTLEAIGERVGAEIAIPFGDEEKFGVLVKREEVREAIRKIMAEGKDREDRRERARKLAEKARMAIEEGGSSYIDIALLIEDIRKLAMGTQV
uniref:Glycosyltransferase n=1 Tax=Fagus sylvatica TaxID=28930 RepID=A0A2N9GNJ5_FAGSY